MKKFNQNLETAIIDKAVAQISQRSFEVTCPHCNSMINVPSGKSICPICCNEVDLKLDFDI